MRVTSLMVGLALMAAANITQAQDIELEAGADFYGKYIWRGQNVTDEPVIQPWVIVSYSGLTAGFWGNMDLTGINDRSGDFTEYNWALDYSALLSDQMGYSLGVIHYYFPSDGDTTEVYASLFFETLLNPSLTVYYDVDEVEGFYVFGGIEHSIDEIARLTPEIPIGLEFLAGIGWGDSDYTDSYWGVSSARFQDLTFGLSFPMEISGWTVAPNLNYVTLAETSLRRTNAYSDRSDYFFAGVGISRSF